MTLSEQVAVVTGAAGGLGREVARCLHGAEARMVLVDRDAEGVRSAASEIPDALAIVIDLTAEAASQDVVDQTMQRFGRLDILANVAGTFEMQPTDEVTWKDWERVFTINLHAPFFLCQSAARVMRARRRGCIVNISSTAGYYPRANQAAYCASKAAVEHLSRVLALELSPFGIRVNTLRPGTVATEMIHRAFGEETLARMASAVPLGKLATPTDIAEGVLYLVSATHVTGQVLCIDGGQTINFVTGRTED